MGNRCRGFTFWLEQHATRYIKVRSVASRRGRPPMPPSTLAVSKCVWSYTARPVVRRESCDTANDRRWDNYRRSALFVQQQVGRRVGPCVLVNAVCASDQNTCETTRAVSAAQRLRNIDGKCRTAAPHTRNQGLITNLSRLIKSVTRWTENAGELLLSKNLIRRIRRSFVNGHAFDGSSPQFPQEMEHCKVFSLKSKRHVTLCDWRHVLTLQCNAYGRQPWLFILWQIRRIEAVLRVRQQTTA